MKGNFDETEMFLTTDKDLTTELAETYGSLSLALEERQKSRANTGAPR